MRIVTWNIRHGSSKQKLPHILVTLTGHNADLIILTEYQIKEHLDIPGNLARLGWKHQVSTPPTPKLNGLLIASRVEIALGPACEPTLGAPERWQELSIPSQGFSVLAVHIPGAGDKEDKKSFWEHLIRWAETRLNDQCLIIGDFNTGKAIDAEGTPFKFPEFMDRLENLGWVDAWRLQNPSAREFTWYSNHGNGFRLDYAFTTPIFQHRLSKASHSHRERTAGYSDHSALIVDIAHG